VSHSSKTLPFRPIAFHVCFVVLILCCTLVAQEGFNPRGGSSSPYQNGTSQQATPGVSTFKDTTLGKPGSTFGQRGGTPFTPSAGSQRSQEPLGSTSNYGASAASDGQVSTCTIEYVDEIDVPALELGLLVAVNVKEGDSIPAGFEIAKIDDTILKHSLRQALVRKTNSESIANDATSIEAAEKQIQLTGQRYETTRSLFRKGARSYEEKQTARYEFEVAQLQRRAAMMRQLEARGEADLENARASEVEERIRRHTVLARFDGVVIKRYKQTGEWVTAGEPVARVARMDKLYVTGLISNNEYNPSDVKGKNVVVTVELARKKTMEFRGKITTIGFEDIAGTGNEFQVKAEIDNEMLEGEWALRKNSRVSMRILD
jgi:multidrug efflux pump subunit AcrA (membrane-fusion protein)